MYNMVLATSYHMAQVNGQSLSPPPPHTSHVFAHTRSIVQFSLDYKGTNLGWLDLRERGRPKNKPIKEKGLYCLWKIHICLKVDGSSEQGNLNSLT
jgi:hypothetical protein